MVVRLISLLSILFLATACLQTVPKDYASFRNADPKSLLIVPAVNRSLEVTAPDYFLATISRPLAERGYYVFPVYLVKRVMEEDGMSDADMVHAEDPVQLASLFSADAILYVTIQKWESQYAVFATNTQIEIDYVIKDGSTGVELWSHNQKMNYSPSQNSGGGIAGLIANAITAATEKAAPNYIPLARQANAAAFNPPHQGLPSGPYAKAYQQDMADY
ncbi:MAG: DUF799 family lipoprotein [Magnetovibrio sp.]|nr:DUF799 family lipoprotein [Magnetovibrio sp.]